MVSGATAALIACFQAGVYLTAARDAVGWCRALGAICGPRPAYRQIFGSSIRHVPVTERLVALTYDDGPSPGTTERIMDALERHGARGTFFMLGSLIEQHPDLAAEVVRRGHQVGNHGYSHAWLVFRSPSFIRNEVGRTDRLLAAAGVVGDVPFRAPYGGQLFVLPWVLRTSGKTNVLFDVVPRDWEVQDAEQIAARVLAAIRPGSIVLLHDGGGERAATVEATARLLAGLEPLGYRAVTVAELLASASGRFTASESAVELQTARRVSRHELDNRALLR